MTRSRQLLSTDVVPMEYGKPVQQPLHGAGCQVSRGKRQHHPLSKVTSASEERYWPQAPWPLWVNYLKQVVLTGYDHRSPDDERRPCLVLESAKHWSLPTPEHNHHC